MKNLLKLPLLLITLLLIFSCGRSVKGDINEMKKAAQKIELIYKEPNKKDLEDHLGLILELEEIISYYVNDANSDETLSFIRLFNDADIDSDRIDDREDLKKAMDELKELKDELKYEIIRLDIPTAEADYWWNVNNNLIK